MPRSMSSAMLTALQATELQPCFFVQVQFASTTVYLWSGRGTTTWNGQTWVGAGSLLGLTVMEEGSNVQARGITLSLSGLDSGILSDFLTEYQVGLPVTVYMGLYSGGALIASPIASWSGRVDQPAIDIGPDKVIISINCENRMMEMNVAVERRYTQDDQQLDNPGDLGFEFVPGLQLSFIYWGRTPFQQFNQ
jgi:hypothetical protein